MPARRLLAVGLWLSITAVATAIVWVGTSTVAADLTDRPPPVVPHEEVVEALQPGPSDAETAPGITTPGASSSPSTVPAGGRGPATAAPDGPVPGPSSSPAPQPGVVTPAPASAPPTIRPGTPPPTQPAQRPTATYSTAGGVVTVGCTGPFNYLIELVSATPRNGYAVNVVSAGPYYVEVHFVRPGRDEPLWAYCLGQPFRAYGGPPAQGQAPGPS